MVNNNGIPFEVKKPFETVYEIKNKIPSLEEFMKSYENDANLNYDDLNVGDIGSDKGYGPCSDSKCYGSNACQSGEFFYPLRVPCPTERCRGKGGSPISWVHAKSGCGYNTSKISNKARIRCPDCFNTSHMKYHRFACSSHRGEYERTSSTSFSDALFVAFNNNEMPKDVFMDLLAELKGVEW